MDGLFLNIVNMSMTATIIGALIAILRRLLKRRLPRWVFYLAWVGVLARLLTPFAVSSPASVFNMIPVARTIAGQGEIPGGSITFVERIDVRVIFPTLHVPSVPQTDGSVRPDLLPTDESEVQGTPVITHTPIPIITILTSIWLCGAFFLLIYSLICYIYTLTRLRNATCITLCEEETERIFALSGVSPKQVRVCCSSLFSGPVVCGLFRPRLVLPASVAADQLPHVLAHELTHIRRHDNLWKAAATLALYLHWFNPFLWWIYRLYVIDMETSCDEAVVRRGYANSRDYAACLLDMATRNANVLTGGFLAFGEGALKERIQSIMHVRKATIFLTIVCFAVLTGMGIIFLTNPQQAIEQNIVDTNLPQEIRADDSIQVALQSLEPNQIFSVSIERKQDSKMESWMVQDKDYDAVLTLLRDLPLNQDTSLNTDKTANTGIAMYVNFDYGGGLRLFLADQYLELQGAFGELNADSIYCFRLNQEEAELLQESLAALKHPDSEIIDTATEQEQQSVSVPQISNPAPIPEKLASGQEVPDSAPANRVDTPALDTGEISGNPSESESEGKALAFYEENPAALKLNPSDILFANIIDRDTHRSAVLSEDEIWKTVRLLHALPPGAREQEDPDPANVRLLQISMKDGTRYLYWIHNNLMTVSQTQIADSTEVDPFRRLADSALAKAGREGRLSAEWIGLLNPYRITQIELYNGVAGKATTTGEAGGGMAIYSADISNQQREVILDLAMKLKALPVLSKTPIERMDAPDQAEGTEIDREIRLHFDQGGETHVIYLFRDGTMHVTAKSIEYYTAYTVIERAALLEAITNYTK